LAVFPLWSGLHKLHLSANELMDCIWCYR